MYSASAQTGKVSNIVIIYILTMCDRGITDNNGSSGRPCTNEGSTSTHKRSRARRNDSGNMYERTNKGGTSINEGGTSTNERARGNEDGDNDR